MIYRLIRPASLAAQRLGCACRSKAQIIGNCPYHGFEARRLIHG